ncbi:hypothetical protein [Mycoplasma crocodyli]|uniref:Uncharacterized protein n=1 Tax=Mycoplasma crocodyli (strain ATCC 51981 / MP145) TaxID=512564 RepID=D5E4U7_MYCCM|nr:hypothetical protein [Mycoplasma crocodyli]ADE19960.1 hypothetical protein MCRO_0115 [Mycoplasma crocodyli MP145]
MSIKIPSYKSCYIYEDHGKLFVNESLNSINKKSEIIIKFENKIYKYSCLILETKNQKTNINILEPINEKLNFTNGLSCSMFIKSINIFCILTNK